MNKATLRLQLKADRSELTPEEIAAKSREIVQRVIQLIHWPQLETLHCFTPISALNEVDTKALFDFIWDKQGHVTTYTALPFGNEWKSGKAMRGMFTETISGLPSLDVIIVPMLGFDKQLHRLGYGSGFYDRFLTGQPRALKVGVCFELGKLTSLPRQSHDVALDLVVTEQHVYTPA